MPNISTGAIVHVMCMFLLMSAGVHNMFSDYTMFLLTSRSLACVWGYYCSTSSGQDQKGVGSFDLVCY